MSYGKEARWAVDRNAPTVTHDEAGLRRLPIGTVLWLDLGNGLAVKATRHHEDRFEIHSGAVPIETLANRPTRRCVQRASYGRTS